VIYRLTWKGHFNSGQQFATGVHIHTAPPPLGSEPAIADVLTAWDTHLYTAFRACINASLTIDTEELRSVPDPNSADVPAVTALVKNQVGTLANGTGTLPDGISAILQIKSSAASRSGRGYMGLPSPMYSSYLASNNAWGTGLTTPVNAFGNLLKDTLTIGTLLDTHTSCIVYSKTRAIRSESPNEWDIVSASLRSKPSWRRSRMN
jgi:hypothetical protein